MELFLSILIHPITIVVIGLLILFGLIISPYEIHFDDKEESEI